MKSDRIASLLSLLDKSFKDSYADITAPIDPDRITSCNTAENVAQHWKAIIDADSHKSWPNQIVRVFALVSLLERFEELRLQDYVNLRSALAELKTLAGRPLNVVGTRCELASRTGEALFFEGRGDPGNMVCFAMLEVADDLLSIVLSECRQKDDPKYAKRWYGIRGVCRLMLAVHRNHSSVQEEWDRFKAAANDLERAFRLGNRGASAATYLLDALTHLLPFDQSEATLAKLGEIIELLEESEKDDRGVLFHIGKYEFARSFSLTESRSVLVAAIEFLTNALELPPVMSIDDAIVRLVRGQAYIRLAMTYPDENSSDSLAAVNDGIEDLKFAFLTAPEKFGKQASLPSVLQTRADIFSRRGKYSEAREDLLFATRIEFADANPELFSKAQLKLMLVDLREAMDKHDLTEIERLLPAVLDHEDCLGTGSFYAALATKRLFGSKTASDDPSLLIKTIEMLKVVDLSTNPDPESRRMHLSILAGLQFRLGDQWISTVLEDAVETYVCAMGESAETVSAEILSLYGDCCLTLAKQILMHEDNSERAAELLEDASAAFSSAAQIAETDEVTISESFKLVVTFSKAGEAQLRLCTLTGSAEDGRKAITNFERAYALGNTTHELLGLLGDAYYRVFGLTRDRNLLESALRHKQGAREAGAKSRENLSLSSKLSIMQWEHSSNEPRGRRDVGGGSSRTFPFLALASVPSIGNDGPGG